MKIKNLIILFLVLILYVVTHIKAQFVWAKSFGSNQPERGTAIAVDAAGNVYSVGTFTFTVDFDPSASVFNLTSAGSTDIYILKLDATGNFVWAKNVGGTGADSPLAITIDAIGNIYVTGSYNVTSDFDPNAGTLNLTSLGGTDIFTLKLDATGNMVWAKSMGGIGATDEGKGIAVDASNNVYITGSFLSTVDFDPNAGIFNLTSAGSSDVFIMKLDNLGNFIWANKVGGTGVDKGNGIDLDGANNVYIVGSFASANVDFDSGAGTALKSSVGNTDVFVLKLLNSGIYGWVSTMGGSGIDDGNTIDIDAFGNVYTSGRFFGASNNDYDPGIGTFILFSSGSSDIFVSKLNSLGSFVWAKQIGGPRADVGLSLSTDATGNIYLSGNFQTFTAEVADFDPNAGVFNLTSQSLTIDVFIVSLDAAGDFRCAGKVGGSGTDNDASITTDAIGNNYLTGEFVSTADLDPFSGTFNLTANNVDPFILKLSGCSVVLPITLSYFNARCEEKHVELTWQTVTEINNDFFVIERSSDLQNWTIVTTIKGAGNSNSVKDYLFKDDFLSNEVAYYRLKQIDFDGNFEYFDIVAVKCLNQNKNNIIVFPNPINRFLNINFGYINQSNSTIEIVDLLGNKLISGNLTISQFGNKIFSIDLNNLPKGVYLLKIGVSNESYVVEKIIKQ